MHFRSALITFVRPWLPTRLFHHIHVHFVRIWAPYRTVTGTPLVYELDDNLKPIPQKDAIAPLQGRYLGDIEAIKARIEGVKNQTK